MKAAITSLYKECKSTALTAGNRKYSLLVLSFALLVIGLAVTGLLPQSAAQYTAFVSGITFLYGVYCGANVGAKWSPETAKDQQAVAITVKAEKDKVTVGNQPADGPGPQGK